MVMSPPDVRRGGHVVKEKPPVSGGGILNRRGEEIARG